MKKTLLAGLAVGLFFGGMSVTMAQANPLVNGLGGSAGFGENYIDRNDDGYTGAIDVTSVFASGLNFFGSTYSSLYLNNNGNITFNGSMYTYTPWAIRGGSAPIIAPFFADVDTRSGVVTPTAGGTSTGSNLVWWDLDTTNNVFTATWDDVGYFRYNTEPVNAFQLRLTDRSGVAAGDFDITFIYEDIDWTVGDWSDEVHARAGWSSGNLIDFYEMPQSGDEAALTSLESSPGIITWEVRNGGIVHTDGHIGPGTPIPEPATIFLLGTGLSGLIAARRKKKA